MKTVVISRAAVHTGSLILVNPAHPVRNIPLREELQPPFDSAPQILLQRRAAVMLRCLTADIGAEKKILPVSGYRTGREQQKLYAETMAEKGEDFTRKFVAIPGCSEHETGLAVDLAEKGPEIDFIRPSFPDTGLCGTFRRRAAAYGFIQRLSLIHISCCASFGVIQKRLITSRLRAYRDLPCLLYTSFW